MYRVIGQDGREYGPTTADEVRTWINQGRLGAQSKIKQEGSAEWKALCEMIEFAGAVPAAPPPVGLAEAVAAKTSGLAIASLVLGALGIFTVGITAVVGLVLGIIALFKINKSQGQLRGLGLAVAGIVLSGMVFMMIPVMAALLLPALARAKSKAQTVQCMNHVKQINLAVIMYANDHNNTLPSAESWCELIKPYVGPSTAVFECPSQPKGRCSYGFNVALSNKRISEVGDPAQLVLVFSTGEGWNQAGGRDLALPHLHSRNALTLGFADGHTEVVAVNRASSKTWLLGGASPGGTLREVH